jgi:hypothetical protein
MAKFYKGVGVGTFLHPKDLRIVGLAPHNPGGTYDVDAIMRHVAHGTTISPCISLTRSYGVAYDYAVNGGRAFPDASNPAYVYEIDIADPAPTAGSDEAGQRFRE